MIKNNETKYDKEKTLYRAEQELDKTVEEKDKELKKTKEMRYGKLFMNQKKEIMYFIMNDGSIVDVTSNKGRRIKEKIKIKVKDIKTVIHNHLEIPEFSKSDEDFYSHLREKGFKGKFLLYVKNLTYSLNKKDLDKPSNK